MFQPHADAWLQQEHAYYDCCCIVSEQNQICLGSRAKPGSLFSHQHLQLLQQLVTCCKSCTSCCHRAAPVNGPTGLLSGTNILQSVMLHAALSGDDSDLVFLDNSHLAFQVVEGSVEGSPEGGSTARADLLGFLSDGASMLVRSSLLQVCCPSCRCFHLCRILSFVCTIGCPAQLAVRCLRRIFLPVYTVTIMSALTALDVY